MKINIAKIAYISSCLILFCLVLSCQNDQIDINNNQVSINSKNGTVIDGRFFFTSKETLKQTMEEFKALDNSDLEAKFEKLYQKGFRSHSPIVNPNNQELMSKLENEIISNQKLYKKTSLNKVAEEEAEDNTIGDPFFGAVVNQNNEIIVGDSIYKITKDLGVLFIHIRDTTHLYNYLNKLNILSKIGKNAKINIIAPCDTRSQYPGVTSLDEVISRYIAPVDDGGCGSYGGGSTVTPPAPQLSEDQILQEQISKLTRCKGEDTSLFQSLFGTNKSCINYFDSSHRVKTEFWNQSWAVYKSVGVQVRTQVKRVGIWWASDADQIHLGINRIYLKYKFPDPEINSQLFDFSYNQLAEREKPVYMYKGEFKIYKDNYGGYIYPTFIKANTKLPFFNFGGDELNIYIRKLPYLGDYDIKSESNIKAIYKLGIDFLKNKINSNKEFVVSYQKNESEVEVIYFGERFKNINAHQVIRKFYADKEFVLSATYNPDGGSPNSSTGNPNGSFTFDFGPPEHSYFRDYTDYELDFYGLAHQNGIWSGNRMISPK